MKLVMHLSGRAMTERFHNENDSVVGTVNVPESAMLRDELISMAVIDGNKMPHVSTDGVSDLVDDLQGEFPEFYEEVMALIGSECSCGILHIDGLKATMN